MPICPVWMSSHPVVNGVAVKSSHCQWVRSIASETCAFHGCSIVASSAVCESAGNQLKWSPISNTGSAALANQASAGMCVDAAQRANFSPRKCSPGPYLTILAYGMMLHTYFTTDAFPDHARPRRSYSFGTAKDCTKAQNCACLCPGCHLPNQGWPDSKLLETDDCKPGTVVKPGTECKRTSIVNDLSSFGTCQNSGKWESSDSASSWAFCDAGMYLDASSDCTTCAAGTSTADPNATRYGHGSPW